MKKGIFTLTLVCSLPICANDFQVYTLKKGDNISELLHARGYAPLYGNDQWVEKVLDANKLIYKTAKKIDTGSTILLPNKGAFKEPKQIDKKLFVIVKADKVTTQTSAILKTGLLGNTISKHQDVMVDFTYSNKETQFSGGTFSQTNNTRLGIIVQGKNDYQVSRTPFNVNGSVFITSHGPGELDHAASKGHLARFQPTYELNTDVQFNVKTGRDYKLSVGPAISLQEASEVQNFDGQFAIERNLSFWAGVRASAIVDFKSFDSINDISLTKKQYIGTVSDQYSDNTYSMKLNSKVHLTESYFAGFTYEYENTSDSNLESANTFGFNLSYNLK